jgi:hypothetical protein
MTVTKNIYVIFWSEKTQLHIKQVGTVKKKIVKESF